MNIAKKQNRGGALLLVLLVVSILSAVVLSSIAVLQRNMERQFARSSEVQAEALALRGLSLGSHPDVERYDPLLRSVTSDGDEGYEVIVRSEGARIDLNSFLQGGDKAMLIGLFEEWEISNDDAVDIVDAMVDWIDADDLLELNGAEDSYYDALGFTDLPYNRPFATLADVRLVKKFDLIETAKPDWQDYFTVVGDPRIDIHEAPVDILVAAGEVDEFQAEIFRQTIFGEDEEFGTEDDFRYTALDTALDDLGVLDDEVVRARVTRRFNLRSAVRRVTSIGQVGGTTKEITIIVRQRGQSSAILRYQESLRRSTNEE